MKVTSHLNYSQFPHGGLWILEQEILSGYAMNHLCLTLAKCEVLPHIYCAPILLLAEYVELFDKSSWENPPQEKQETHFSCHYA